MWNCNSNPYGLGSIRHCMCHTATVPWFCTNPMSQCYNNVLPYSTNLLPYHENPENLICDFSNYSNHVNLGATQQMVPNEFDSWLLPNLDDYQINGCLNPQRCTCLSQFYQKQPQCVHINYYGNCCQSSRPGLMEQQQQQQQILKLSQGIQHDFSLPASLSHVSLPPTDDASIIPETTIGIMDFPQEWTDEFSFLPSHPINIFENALESHSNSTSISIEGIQQLASTDASNRPSNNSVPMSRQDRIQRYIEKKKARKYVSKLAYTSRQIYAQIRPRVRGRFARISQTDV